MRKFPRKKILKQAVKIAMWQVGYRYKQDSTQFEAVQYRLEGMIFRETAGWPDEHVIADEVAQHILDKWATDKWFDHLVPEDD